MSATVTGAVSKRVLLIIGGGIAAYKCLDLVRRLRERAIATRVIMTRAAHEFVTPLSLGALTNDKVFTDLFDLDDEREIGHIRLSRDADLVVVAPATADLMARMAGGHADDLATAVLMATDKPVLVAPAMNPRMWLHPATRRNAAQLAADGIAFIGPNEGEMAERGEAGPGRMAEPLEIVAEIERRIRVAPNSATAKPDAAASPHRATERVRQHKSGPGVLEGRHVLITSGPTHEPIDPVRYIANRSSGKQGHAIAAAAARLGARVTLVCGPVSLPDPEGVDVVRVETAREMLAAVRARLPADVGIFAAAVADWGVERAEGQKIKKAKGAGPPALKLVENPDILRTVAAKGAQRPRLVVGFAAETEQVIEHAKRKLKSKGADWIVANDVGPETNVMGGDRNTVHIISVEGVETWPQMSKHEVAERLMVRVADQLSRSEAAE